MKINMLKSFKLTAIALIAMVFLTACDSPELRKALGPAREQIEIGMSFDDVETLLNTDYPDIQVYEYAFTESENNYFGWDDDKEMNVPARILQVTKSDSNSICFFKLLFTPDAADENQVITIGKMACPA